MSLRLAVATALAFGILAAPAAAAPALQPLKECYVSAGVAEDRREGIEIRGSGFTPGSFIDIYIDGEQVLASTQPQVDVVGDVTATVKAPFHSRGEREFTLTVTERDSAGNVNPANTVTTTSRVTALRVELSPREARPSARVRFRGRGFTAPGPVYAHYVYRSKVRKTVRLARRPQTCGTFDVRRRQIPIARPRVGNWTLQIDQQQSYSAEPTSNWVRMLIRVRQVFLDPGT